MDQAEGKQRTSSRYDYAIPTLCLRRCTLREALSDIIRKLRVSEWSRKACFLTSEREQVRPQVNIVGESKEYPSDIPRYSLVPSL